MRLSILQIKLIHTAIFYLFSGCVVYALYSGLVNQITLWTWTSVAVIFAEGVVLAVFGWKCPLTILAEKLGARTDLIGTMFLPKWFEDRVFPICGTLFAAGCLLLLFRWLAG